MEQVKYKRVLRQKRAWRKRKKMQGSAERPRLSVYRSNRNMTAQLIDDIDSRTLYTLSSLSPELKESVTEKKNKTEWAEVLGLAFGEKIKEMGIERVVFDVGPYRFHGRVKAFADSVLKTGIRF